MRTSIKFRFFCFLFLWGIFLFLSADAAYSSAANCQLDLPPRCLESDSEIQLTVDVNEFIEPDLYSCDLNAPAYFRSFISGAGAGFEYLNGEQAGWCIEVEGEISEGTSYRVDFYSSVDPGLPDFLSEIQWDQINWILNNKQFFSGAG